MYASKSFINGVDFAAFVKHPAFITIAIIIGIGAILFIGMQMVFYIYKKRLNTPIDDREEIMSNANTKDKILIIYYPSKHGTTKKIVDKISKYYNENGYEVTINVASCKKAYATNTYKKIFLISPVYFGKISGFLKKFVQENVIENQIVYLVNIGKLHYQPKEFDNLLSSLSDTNKVFKLKLRGDEKDIKDAIENLSH